MVSNAGRKGGRDQNKPLLGFNGIGESIMRVQPSKITGWRDAELVKQVYGGSAVSGMGQKPTRRAESPAPQENIEVPLHEGFSRMLLSHLNIRVILLMPQFETHCQCSLSNDNRWDHRCCWVAFRQSFHRRTMVII